MTTDHRNKYNDEKVWNVRITKMWPTDNEVRKCCWKNGTERRPQCRGATNPQFAKNTIKVSNKKRYTCIFNLHKRPYCFIHRIEKSALEVKLSKLIKLTSTQAKIKRQIWGKNNLSNSKVTQSQPEATQLVRNVLKYKIHVI